MTTYLIQRIASGAAVIVGLICVTFLASHYIGDPVFMMIDRELDTPEDRQRLIEAGGFDRPVWEQFAVYIGDVARGDFGNSLWQNRPATEVVLERVPATALLAGSVLLVTWVIAIPLAIVAGRRAGSWVDTTITTVSVGVSSFSSFWFGLVLIIIFAVRLGWLPTSGYGGIRYLVLPVLALAPAMAARVTQVLQTSVTTELRQQYVATARAKGLPERTVMSRHVLRNTALLGLTLLGGEVVSLMNGVILVETIFAWPGVGQISLQAIEKRDVRVLMAAVFYIGLLVTVLNIAVDLIYTYIDPRVRLK